MKVAQEGVESFCDLFQSQGVFYKDRRAQSAALVNDWLAVLWLGKAWTAGLSLVFSGLPRLPSPH